MGLVQFWSKIKAMIAPGKPRYTERRFSEEEKRRLAEMIRSLRRKRSVKSDQTTIDVGKRPE